MNLNMILYVIIYSFIGWICECVYCSIGQKQMENKKHPEYIKQIKEIIKQKFNELNEKHKK